MEIYIEIMLVLLVFWLVANFWMRFMPQYATQLPIPI
ncbi:uncharacterized protein METZ01_LOCUS321987, partial [marine metagenome]